MSSRAVTTGDLRRVAELNTAGVRDTAGNAVTPLAARDLIAAAVASLGSEHQGVAA